MIVDLASRPPPVAWGVSVDVDAIDHLGDLWANEPMPLPTFDYPGTPQERPEAWWFDYVTMAVSVLACLWPPEGDDVWQVEHDGAWLDDAPGIFAAFTRDLGPAGIDLERLASMPADAHDLFAGRGTLQLIRERIDVLNRAAATILDRWQGSVANLVAEAGRDSAQVAALLSETMPGYQDRPTTEQGQLPFDKLSHLAAALMAAGVGWAAAGFHNYDDFPVYPDYMLPRVFRHHGVMQYSPALAAAIDGRQLISADSEAEHAIRWATVYAGARLRAALQERGNDVGAPALDYRLWSAAVLGPDADSFGEHHRTLTLRY